MSQKKSIENLLIRTGFILTVVGALAVIFSGYGYQWKWWDLGTAFRTLIPYGSYLAMFGGVLILVSLIVGRKNISNTKVFAGIGLFLAIAVAINAYVWSVETKVGYPPIHDITTDVQNPPEFVKIAPLREEAPNPVEYQGEEVSKVQLDFYPQVKTYRTDLNYDDAYDKALEAAQSMPWELVDENRFEGRIEAFHKLPWFGFIDDVVIRVAEDSLGTKIDVRSKSRVGRGDLGVNAKRIEDYLEKF